MNCQISSMIEMSSLTPVKERDSRLDSNGNHALYKIIIMCYTLLVQWTISKREKSRP